MTRHPIEPGTPLTTGGRPTGLARVTAQEDLLNDLRRTGETLPPRLRRGILELGSAAVPALIALLDDDAAALEDAPGEGWPPIHAVDLLGELGAIDALPTMLRVLRESHFDEILHNRIAVSVPKLGAPAFEPVMAFAAEPGMRDVAACIVADLGVRDERVYELLTRVFADEPYLGASLFGSYGDERAAPLLARAIVRVSAGRADGGCRPQ